jgi:GTPase involved in cell partitioning and DNA repair
MTSLYLLRGKIMVESQKADKSVDAALREELGAEAGEVELAFSHIGVGFDFLFHIADCDVLVVVVKGLA